MGSGSWENKNKGENFSIGVENQCTRAEAPLWLKDEFIKHNGGHIYWQSEHSSHFSHVGRDETYSILTDCSETMFLRHFFCRGIWGPPGDRTYQRCPHGHRRSSHRGFYFPELCLWFFSEEYILLHLQNQVLGIYTNHFPPLLSRWDDQGNWSFLSSPQMQPSAHPLISN